MKQALAVIAMSGLLAGCTPEPKSENANMPLVTTVSAELLSDEELRHIDHALDGLGIASGLEATLFAAEPMLVNPTNIDIDARGRVWVCEGINYRPQLNPQNPAREEKERIVILEDTDGDGVADERKVFYEGHDINAALGIAVLGNKVIVSASPYVLLLTDEDGDDVADSKEIIFQGIEGVQHDHAVHAFVFGPDGKLYFNFGNEGNLLLDKDGNQVRDRHGVAIQDARAPYQEGMVFRMNMDGSDLEVLGHNFRNNYEVAIDSYGTLWQSDNDDDGNEATRINYVMEFGNYGFRDEMTGANWRVKRTGMHEEIPLRHWHLRDPGVVPNLLQTGAGSPTGMAIYEGDLLPEVFQNQMIHTDAGPNVVRAYPVQKDGAGYTAHIADIMKGIHDSWFRPSDVAVAPDGSIIVADWYDPGVGGHHVGDLSQGRLYRIAPPNTPYEAASYDLSTPEGAVQLLQSPNMARRYLAWTALQEAGEAAEPVLLELWNGQHSRMRARALWLLGNIEGKGVQYVDDALADDDEDIRIAGIRLARQLGLDMIPYLATLVHDDSPQIRREGAIALRGSESPEAPALWATLASHHDGRDRWYLEALGIAAEGQWDAFFNAWADQNQEDWDTPGGRDIIWRARTEAALPMLTDFILDASTSAQEQLRYFRAYDFHPASDTKADQVHDLLATENTTISVLGMLHLVDNLDEQDVDMRMLLNSLLDEIEGQEGYINLVNKYQLQDRVAGLYRMAFSMPEDQVGIDAATLALMMDDGAGFDAHLVEKGYEDVGVEFELLRRVGISQSRDVLERVILDASLAIDTRRLALSQYGPGWTGENRILGLLEEGRFPAELTDQAASILFNSGDSRRRMRAAQFLDPPVAQGGEPLPLIADLVKMDGDAAAGGATFQALCSSCHVVGGEGIDFGPALNTIGSKLPPEGLFNAIIHPSAGIGFGYEGYELQLADGGAAVGYLLSQDAASVTLRQMGDVTTEYDRENIASMQELDVSLMPELAAGMTPQQLVDLVAYLTTLE